MNGYVAGGWGATAGVLAVYSLRIVLRGRALAKRLAPRGLAGREKP